MLTPFYHLEHWYWALSGLALCLSSLDSSSGFKPASVPMPRSPSHSLCPRPWQRGATVGSAKGHLAGRAGPQGAQERPRPLTLLSCWWMSCFSSEAFSGGSDMLGRARRRAAASVCYRRRGLPRSVGRAEHGAGATAGLAQLPGGAAPRQAQAGQGARLQLWWHPTVVFKRRRTARPPWCPPPCLIISNGRCPARRVPTPRPQRSPTPLPCERLRMRRPLPSRPPSRSLSVLPTGRWIGGPLNIRRRGPRRTPSSWPRPARVARCSSDSRACKACAADICSPPPAPCQTRAYPLQCDHVCSLRRVGPRPRGFHPPDGESPFRELFPAQLRAAVSPAARVVPPLPLGLSHPGLAERALFSISDFQPAPKM